MLSKFCGAVSTASPLDYNATMCGGVTFRDFSVGFLAGNTICCSKWFLAATQKQRALSVFPRCTFGAGDTIAHLCPHVWPNVSPTLFKSGLWRHTKLKISCAIFLPCRQSRPGRCQVLRRASSQGEKDACDIRGLGCSRLDRMPRNCTVCRHAHRREIEADLQAGLSYRDVTRRYSISKDAVSRHRGSRIAAWRDGSHDPCEYHGAFAPSRDSCHVEYHLGHA